MVWVGDILYFHSGITYLGVPRRSHQEFPGRAEIPFGGRGTLFGLMSFKFRLVRPRILATRLISALYLSRG